MTTRRKILLSFRRFAFVLTAVVSFISHDSEAYAQDTAKIDITGRKFYLGIGLGPAFNKIHLSGTDQFADVTLDSKKSFQASLDIDWFFSRHAGISTGIGYEVFNNELFLESYADSFPSTDSDNESYERRVSASEISEFQNISFINIPLLLDFRIPVFRRSFFIFNGGLNISFPLVKNYSSQGTFSFTGYYPSYNVLFRDLPEYGFQSETGSSTEGDLTLEPYILHASGSARYIMPIKDNFMLGIAVGYNRSLTELFKNDNPEDYQLSSEINQINSIFGGIDSSVIEAFSFRITLGFFMK